MKSKTAAAPALKKQQLQILEKNSVSTKFRHRKEADEKKSSETKRQQKYRT